MLNIRFSALAAPVGRPPRAALRFGSQYPNLEYLRQRGNEDQLVLKDKILQRLNARLEWEIDRKLNVAVLLRALQESRQKAKAFHDARTQELKEWGFALSDELPPVHGGNRDEILATFPVPFHQKLVREVFEALANELGFIQENPERFPAGNTPYRWILTPAGQTYLDSLS